MIYQQFASTDIVAGRSQQVSSGFFNDGNYSVAQNSTNFYTNATQTQATGSGNYNYLNGLYYWNVYYNNQVHFSLAYGDANNSGSSATDISTIGLSPFEANYNSYVNLLLTPTETLFSFVTGSYNTTTNTFSNQSTITSPSIFIINFGANLYKNQVDQGQLQFSLRGANGTFTFIDDSSISGKVANVYNIIQGSIVNGVATPYTSGGVVPYQSLGLFYPKNGTVILNASAIASLIGNIAGGVYSDGTTGLTFYATPSLNVGTTNAYAMYQSCLYNAIVNATGYYMNVRKSELIPTTQYYVRVQNSNFNYTNNPTFVSNGNDGTGLSAGTIKIPALQTNPTTYITTVGLYDVNNQLVAVAKLSSPVPKSFDSEYLIKVGLAY